MYRFFYILIILNLLLLSCGKKKEIEDDVLLRYGDKTLTFYEIEERIPIGIPAEDSVALFHSLIDNWIEDNVLSAFAEERLYDLSAIDKKVEEYRNHLIVLEYLNRMRDSHSPKIEPGKVKEYYDLHKKEIKLETPLVKGIFVKLNSETPGKEEIKKLLMSDEPDKIDILEREWIDRALQYNYFRDKWIDWETLKGMIPYRFGDPDKFLESTSYFETDSEDCTYFLKITDWLPSDTIQPFEYAQSWISDILTQGELAEYQRVLVASLIEKSIKDKRLEPVGYDPLKHEYIQH